MNDISKTNTQTRLNRAMETEGIKPSEAARILGIRDNYVSMMRNSEQWPKCPAGAWEATLKWINTGQTLKEYGDKHGKVLPEQKHIELPPKVIAVKKPEPEIKPLKITAENKEKVEAAERLSKHPFFSGVHEEKQRICIDIEINLIINGKKISL
jgi:hypothetical protein